MQCKNCRFRLLCFMGFMHRTKHGSCAYNVFWCGTCDRLCIWDPNPSIGKKHRHYYILDCEKRPKKEIHKRIEFDRFLSGNVVNKAQVRVLPFYIDDTFAPFSRLSVTKYCLNCQRIISRPYWMSESAAVTIIDLDTEKSVTLSSDD